MARYEVLFGYLVGGDEWLKFESDNLDEAVKFWEDYPDSRNFELSWYLYIRDNETRDVLDPYWTEGEGME